MKIFRGPVPGGLLSAILSARRVTSSFYILTYLHMWLFHISSQTNNLKLDGCNIYVL